MKTLSEQQGRKGELAFERWLNAHDIPFLAIEQQRGTLSKALKSAFNTKRPDYVIFIPKVGLILVDVKYLHLHKSPECFTISATDIRQYGNLEKSFNYKVWFAISNELLNNTWYWISVADVITKCQTERKMFTSSNKFRGISREIPLNSCVQIKNDDSFTQLLSKAILKN